MCIRAQIKATCIGLVVVGLVSGASSCGDQTASAPAQRVNGTPAPARHAVHTQKLQAVMSRLGGSVAQDWPQEIADLRAAQESADQRVRFREAAGLAKSLAEAADRIPDAIADAQMTDDEQVAFLANVEQLRKQAGELEAVAAAQDLDGMRATLSRIQTTCYGCHAQFRELAGPLQFGPK